MKLTKENYFSQKTNIQYMSVSQFKSFSTAFGGCEAKAVAELNGEWEKTQTTAFIQGNYLHAWNDGTLDEFKEKNKSILFSSRKPFGLKKDYQQCEVAIERMQQDNFFMSKLNGQKEVILTGEIFGTKWKGMIDVLNVNEGFFADLKYLKKIKDKFWTYSEDGTGYYQSVFEERGYLLQMAVYAELERQHSKRKQDNFLNPFLSIVTKETPPDISIINFGESKEDIQYFVSSQLEMIGTHIERVLNVKNGIVKPKMCGHCDFCRATKKITQSIHFSFFNP